MDEHKGLKAAAVKVLGATIQRCRVHFLRNALACVGKKDRPIVTAALRTAFDQDTLADSKEHWAKPRRRADAGAERRVGGHTSLHDAGNRRRHLRG